MGVQSLNVSENDDFLLAFLKAMVQAQPLSPMSAEHETGFLEWIPDGSLISSVPPECLPETFENQILKKRPRASQFGEIARDYFNRCGPVLSSKATGGLMGLVDFAMASYPFLQNSRVRPTIFKFRDGLQINGFVGVKDQNPRPWVIYKCGVFCSADPRGASLKNYLIHLFDQSPFNVILVGNRTGRDFIKNNQRFNFGGYYEHQDFIDLARWLREESPYAHLVSSVHVVAVSLAGSAAYLTEQRLSRIGSTQKPLIQSVTSLCAVSDLRPTVENMYQEGLKGSIFSKLTWANIESVRGSLPGIDKVIGHQEPEIEHFPRLLGKLASHYIHNEHYGLGDEDFIGDKEKKFWERSQYSSYTHAAPVPLFIWASEDDSVVDFQINTGNLMRQRAKISDSNVAIVGLEKGDHCGFATAYGYPVAASLLRSFILNNSPEFTSRMEQKSIPFKAPKFTLLEGEHIIGHWWSEATKDRTNLQLNFEVYGVDDSLCPIELMYEDMENCRTFAKVEFSEDFFVKYGFKKPINLIEREAMIRELNARVFPLLKGETVVGGTQWPDELRVKF
jgi:hypothetical protein